MDRNPSAQTTFETKRVARKQCIGGPPLESLVFLEQRSCFMFVCKHILAIVHRKQRACCDSIQWHRCHEQDAPKVPRGFGLCFCVSATAMPGKRLSVAAGLKAQGPMRKAGRAAAPLAGGGVLIACARCWGCADWVFEGGDKFIELPESRPFLRLHATRIKNENNHE